MSVKRRIVVSWTSARLVDFRIVPRFLCLENVMVGRFGSGWKEELCTRLASVYHFERTNRVHLLYSLGGGGGGLTVTDDSQHYRKPRWASRIKFSRLLHSSSPEFLKKQWKNLKKNNKFLKNNVLNSPRMPSNVPSSCAALVPKETSSGFWK